LANRSRPYHRANNQPHVIHHHTVNTATFSRRRLTVDAQQNQQQNISEIAQFLLKWDQEMEAIQRGLNGFAITARHDFINQRMQAVGDDKMLELMTLEAKKYAQNRASSSDTSH
jgi:hypothetical protein